MTMSVEFDLPEVHHLLDLLAHDQANLVGQLVLAEERVDAGKAACTSEQWKRALKKCERLPDVISQVEQMQESLRSALAREREEVGDV